MVAKPGPSITCLARASLFLCALTLCSALESHELTIKDVTTKLRLGDNEVLRTEKKFKVFMENYGKRYSTREEYLRRLGIFAHNLVRAAEHQALDPTAVHGVTQFSDLTEDEFQRFYTGVNGGFPSNNGVAPPLEKGVVTEVKTQVSVIDNIYWKELLVTVWILILAIQIGKNYTTNCSAVYWVPITVGTTLYEAVLLYKGQRVISSKGDQQTRLSVRQLFLYCTCGILAGIIGGLLGLGGGFILGPLFIGLGIPPQVSSATSTFAMTFSASMSVVEYYLLKRFPIPYGGVGIANFIKRVEKKEYMGFEDLCS
ncbi:sulfite exporter TauE/SafE family protein 3-like [Cajanus cajan]|uniref:sulfite exporter TauE/SafE family protein 3-like n=1 Tax=Cajanus cajan TaxID=3821 RepID=UPI0010FAE4BE|nr:sulfite exporter TauE/SafE family protein 3-like [Cajanus cajan]